VACNYSTWDIGGCACVEEECTTTLTGTLTGCNALDLQGATVEAYDQTDAGDLLGTTTTDANGDWTLADIPAIPGNDIVVKYVTTRFDDVGVTLEYTTGDPGDTGWTCGGVTDLGTQALAGSVAAGYQCITDCAWPIATSLHITYTGPTLTHTVAGGGGGAWTGSTGYGYPGCGSCPPLTVNVAANYQPAVNQLQLNWFKHDVTPCPGGGTTNAGLGFTSTGRTCYIPGVSAFSDTLVSPNIPGGSPQAALWCTTGVQTATITE